VPLFGEENDFSVGISCTQSFQGGQGKEEVTNAIGTQDGNLVDMAYFLEARM
jgi:hypothetical protein